MRFKKILILVLRKTYLLPLANIMYFCFDLQRNYKKNKIFLKSKFHRSHPPYFLIYDAYGSTSLDWYYNSGRKTAKNISSLVKKYLPTGHIYLLDWGAGLGRITKHLPEKFDLYATDYNKKTVAWCQKNINNVNFSINNSFPPLNLNNNFFDCVISLSIFTHLSEEQHTAWMEELYNKIKPGGILIFSTHGQNTTDRLTKNELKIFNNGNIVTKGNIKKGKKDFLAYHPPTYVKKLLDNKFKLLEYLAGPNFYSSAQDIWVVKK